MADIFISYAHIDNQPFSGEEKGWITHFVNNLRKEVPRKLGRPEYCEIWMDFKLAGADRVTPEIETQLRAAHTFVLFMSKGWLASKWCQRELEYFCEQHPAQLAGHIFMVEIDSVDKYNEAPAILHELLGYPFWKKNDHDQQRHLGWPVPLASDNAYYERLADLSDHLAAVLEKQHKTAPAPPAVKATIYVAPVNDSLYDQRASLISELSQFGIAVLPQGNKQDDNMPAHLSQCAYFVQLLDINAAFGIPCQQYAKAEAAGKPILQWRDPKLDLNASKLDPDQRQLLTGQHVTAASLTDFGRILREKVLPKPKPEPTAPVANPGRMVFVHAGPDDYAHAQAVAQQLRAKGFGTALPRYQGDAATIRKSIERGYQACQVLLMLQQNAAADLVEDYLSDALAQTLQRANRLLIMICQSEGAEELLYFPPGALTLTCRTQFEPDCLEQFLAEMAL